MTKSLAMVNSILWGAPALLMILSVGIFLTIRLRGAQFRLFPEAVRRFGNCLKSGKGPSEGTSPFQALCTALAATVGTGNLAGVAGAICLGGPGAILWMWVCGVLGMVTKYGEAVLAVRFRVKTEQGEAGGPMYVITNGMGSRFHWLAVLYCVCGIAASFGIGNAAQVNAVMTGVRQMAELFGKTLNRRELLLTGALLAALIGPLLFGGGKGIGRAAERLVPFAAVFYLAMCAGVLLWRMDRIPAAFASILYGAVSPRAVTGGMLGSGFLALRTGCSRGVFTNEAGMGTAGIAHGGARVDHPVEQGLMGILEVFLDTIVICTLTALVILVSGVPIPYGTDPGAELTAQAFGSVYGGSAVIFLTIAMILFASATILGWGLYGARCCGFLFGSRVWPWFAAAQSLTIFLSPVLETAIVWQVSELLNALMVLPNLITLAVLSPEIVRLTKEYRKSGTSGAGGGNYADFHQRKPL